MKNKRFKNHLTGAKVTCTDVVDNIVTYRRDFPHRIEGRTIKEHSKPLYVFNEIYEAI